MIRLNPTAISLRPDDVAELQKEMQRRKEATQTTTTTSKANTSVSTKRNGHKGDTSTSTSARSRTERAHANNNTQNEGPPDGAEEARRRRGQMSAQERIGYISSCVPSRFHSPP